MTETVLVLGCRSCGAKREVESWGALMTAPLDARGCGVCKSLHTYLVHDDPPPASQRELVRRALERRGNG
jgi:hypothetical protein